MRLHLFYLDKNWKKRGDCANNYNLIVDMENKTYKVYTNAFYGYYHPEDIEVKKKSDIEDYIDSIIIGLKVTEEYVSNLTIRKFWRYIKRINKHEEYEACRSGQMSGMVTFKEPIQHWMTSIEVTDKYENLKTDEEELRSKIE